MLPWNVEDLAFDAARFSGVVRLFPLPDLVMFPHVMQPLHIFEPRYRDMLNDALDNDGLIAMSVPASAKKRGAPGRPALLPQICLGKVVSHHRLDDGRYNFMLLGVRRGRILKELPQDRTYRRAEVELVDDFQSQGEDFDRSAIQALIAEKFELALPTPEGASIENNVREMLATEVPLGVLTDLVSFALPLAASLKRELLAECDVDRRASLLLDALGKPIRSDDEQRCIELPLPSIARRFPPPLNMN